MPETQQQRRLERIHARLEKLSDKQLAAHIAFCEAFRAAQQQRYPDSWTFPCEHWETPEQRSRWFDTPLGQSWLHWQYGLSGAIGTEVAEARRLQRQRIAARRDDGVLKHAPHRSVLG